MEIYVAHPRDFDFRNGLYLPIRRSPMNREHHFILPHENSDRPFDSKALITGKSLDLLIAEVSNKSIGLGIELGWANICNIPVACIYNIESMPSRSLNIISKVILPYSNQKELLVAISKAIKTYQK